MRTHSYTNVYSTENGRLPERVNFISWSMHLKERLAEITDDK